MFNIGWRIDIMYIPADSIALTEDLLLRIGHLRIEGSESVDEGLLFLLNSVVREDTRIHYLSHFEK